MHAASQKSASPQETGSQAENCKWVRPSMRLLGRGKRGAEDGNETRKTECAERDTSPARSAEHPDRLPLNPPTWRTSMAVSSAGRLLFEAPNSVKRARILSLARRKRLLVLSASTDAAFVRTVGAAINESAANGLYTGSTPIGFPGYICWIMLSPNSEHLISTAPSMSRAKSYVTLRDAMAPLIPLRMRSAASPQPR